MADKITSFIETNESQQRPSPGNWSAPHHRRLMFLLFFFSLSLSSVPVSALASLSVEALNSPRGRQPAAEGAHNRPITIERIINPKPKRNEPEMIMMMMTMTMMMGGGACLLACLVACDDCVERFSKANGTDRDRSEKA